MAGERHIIRNKITTQKKQHFPILKWQKLLFEVYEAHMFYVVAGSETTTNFANPGLISGF